MCLAIPAKILEILPNNLATVELGGVKREVALDFIDDPKVGEYVIVHVGYALNKLDEDEAKKTLELFKEMGAL